MFQALAFAASQGLELFVKLGGGSRPDYGGRSRRTQVQDVFWRAVPGCFLKVFR
jgi:hypothetical protein